MKSHLHQMAQSHDMIMLCSGQQLTDICMQSISNNWKQMGINLHEIMLIYEIFCTTENISISYIPSSSTSLDNFIHFILEHFKHFLSSKN